MANLAGETWTTGVFPSILQYLQPVVAGDTINGTLVVKTAATLEDLLSVPARSEYDVTLQLNATATIDVDMTGNNFIKACIHY